MDGFALCPSFIGTHRLCVNIQRDFAGRVPKQLQRDLYLFSISLEHGRIVFLSLRTDGQKGLRRESRKPVILLMRNFRTC